MQDLSSRVTAPLAPSSMSAGGEVHSNALAMTAPGGTPISAPDPHFPGQDSEALGQPKPGGQSDYAHLVTDGGGSGSRPAEGGGFVYSTEAPAPWKQM